MEPPPSQANPLNAARVSGGTPIKSPRILSCSTCQRKKIRCDRRFPCANCLKAKIDCIPVAPSTSRRGKRYNQKTLLEKLKRYEALLNEHSIKHEPVLPDVSKREESPGNSTPAEDSDHDLVHSSDVEHRVEPSQPCALVDNLGSQSKGRLSIWKFLLREFRDLGDQERPETPSEDEALEFNLHSSWDRLFPNTDHILFGSWARTKPLASLHPQPVHIFRLWQIYLDNVNPLLKITHSPTLQQRLVEAATDFGKIKPEFEALMFSIYCAALMSISEEECLSAFGEKREKLESQYQACCQHALVKANFLRTFDREVLVAFFLFLMCVRPKIDPPSLNSMFGIVVRVAQRLGIHSETSNQTHSPFEAEMRRRLWWQIVLMDARTTEMSNNRNTVLLPTWDCCVPLNINDGDFSPQLQKLPPARNGPTESLFVVMRCEISDFIRHSTCHLEFYAPLLKGVAKELRRGRPSTVDDLEKLLAEKYFKDCDTHVPLHFASRHISVSLLGKVRFAEHFINGQIQGSPVRLNRERIFEKVIEMIEIDTELRTNPLTKGFRWLTCFHFPLPAYFYLLHGLRRISSGTRADRAWAALNTNFDTRNFIDRFTNTNIVKPTCRLVLRAWEARERALKETGTPYDVPNMINVIRSYMPPSTSANNHGYFPVEDANIAFWSELYTPMVQPSMNPEAFWTSISESTFPIDGHTAFYGNGVASNMENLIWPPPPYSTLMDRR